MDFLSVAITIFTHPIVKAVLAAVFANIVIGIIADIKAKVFHWDQQAEFLKTMVLPYVGGAALVQLLLWAVATDWMPPEVAAWSGTGVWTVVIGMLLVRFTRLLKTVAPNLPISLDKAVSVDTPTTAKLLEPDPRQIS